MKSKTCFIFFFFYSLIITNIALMQERAPHGLAYENSVTFSPSAFDFFQTKPENSDATLDTCVQESGCSSLHVAAAKIQEASAQAHQSEDIVTMSIGTRTGNGACYVVNIIYGVAFIIIM